MGDIKRKRKLFSRPKKLFDRERIDEENKLIKEFGLKNKKEIWKAKSKISEFRQRAKSLIGKESEEQEAFFFKLNRRGLNVKDISDVLALGEENLLTRRLQTVVYKKGLANTPKQARQLIVHKHVLVEGKIINIPSYIVPVELEEVIELKVKKIKKKEEPQKVEETPSEEDMEVENGSKEE